MAASYPTAVKTFTTKNTDDTLQPVDTNDLQDEVNAMEAGLLNGTARLNSSGSTLASLHVSGNSTLGSTVAISTQTYIFPSSRASSGDVLTVVSTSGSTATLEWRAPAGTAPVCKVTHSVVQEIANNVWTGLAWDTENIDSTGMHSTAVNSSRINLTSSGVWQVGAQVEWLGNAAPSFRVRVFVNDTDPIAYAAWAAAALDPTPQLAVGVHYATDTTAYVTVQVNCNGSTGRVNAQSSGAGNFGGPRFWAVRLATSA